ncbi:MAG TPA: hypothetical protein VL285_10805 [Bryobacteraceae bacterium]|nr:hypothetical protein [Bryobacteraceae bacterium]
MVALTNGVSAVTVTAPISIGMSTRAARIGQRAGKGAEDQVLGCCDMDQDKKADQENTQRGTHQNLL